MTIKQKFKSSIKRGTGEAYLILKENRELNVSKYIYDAAIKNYAYDTQCEGSRGQYICDIINLSPQKSILIKNVLKHLEKQKKCGENLEQLFDIAKILSLQGNMAAKRSLYKRFRSNTRRGYELGGQSAVIGLDGIEGLKAVAEVRGEMLTKDSDDWEDDWYIRHFQEEHPKVKVMAMLKEVAQNNVFIQKYLDAINENKKLRSKTEQTIYSFDTIKAKLAEGKPARFMQTEINLLTKQSLQQIADAFVNEKNKVKQENYLRIFSSVKFPGDYKVILEIAKDPVSKSNWRVYFAIRSLQFFSGKNIRAFALKKIKHSNSPSIYTPLLINNYKKGDHKLLKAIANKSKNNDTIEDLAINYIDIYKANKDKNCKNPLTIIYSKLTCGIHREDLIRLLIAQKVLPNKIKQEIFYDSREGIRELAIAHSANS